MYGRSKTASCNSSISEFKHIIIIIIIMTWVPTGLTPHKGFRPPLRICTPHFRADYSWPRGREEPPSPTQVQYPEGPRPWGIIWEGVWGGHSRLLSSSPAMSSASRLMVGTDMFCGGGQSVVGRLRRSTLQPHHEEVVHPAAINTLCN